MRGAWLMMTALLLSGCPADPGDTDRDADDDGPLTVTTSLATSEAAAGVNVDVDCSVTNASGEVVTQDTVIDAPESIQISGAVIQGTTAGAYVITCRLAEGDAAEHVPATLQVVPGPVDRLEVGLVPDAAFAAIGAEIAVEWQTTDAFGNEVVVATEDAEITATPPSAVTELQAGRYRMEAEGLVAFEVSLPSLSLDDSTNLVVDGTAPALAITSPVDAAQLTVTGDEIEVTGTVSDGDSAVASVVVNGVTATTTGDTYTATVPVDPGLNVVVATAADGVGNTTVASHALLVAEDFAAITDGSVAVEGTTTRLGAATISDGVREPVADDLAQELLRGSLPVSYSLGPDTVSSSYVYSRCDTKIVVQSLTTDLELVSVQVANNTEPPTLVARDGGFDLEWTGPVTVSATGEVDTQYRSTMNGTFNGCVEPLVCTQGALAAARHKYKDVTLALVGTVTLTGGIDISQAPGETAVVEVSVEASPAVNVSTTSDPQIPIGEFKYSFCNSYCECGNIFVDSWTQPIKTLIDISTLLGTETIADAMAQAAEDLVSSRAVALVDTLQGVEHDQSLAVRPSEGSVHLQTLTDTIDVSVGAVDIATAAQVSTTNARGSAGVWMRGDCLDTAAPQLDLTGTDDLGVATPVDLVNAVLHGGWTASTTSAEPSADRWSAEQALVDAGIELLGVEVIPDLPAIVTDCTGALVGQVGAATVVTQIRYDAQQYTVQTRLAVEADVAMEELNTTVFEVGGPVVLDRSVDLNGAPESLRTVIDDLTARIALDVLLADPLSDAADLLPPPEFSLTPMAPSGLVSQRGLRMAGDGYLTLETCPAICDDGDLQCGPDSDRHRERCDPISSTCSWWATVGPCAVGRICADDDGPAVCVTP